MKVKRLTASGNIDNTATQWLLDGTDAHACTGTPSTTTCSSYTGSGEATCISHLPCVWNPGTGCDVYNNEFNMGTCIATSGCSAQSSSCTGAGDEASCLAQDDSYGGSCVWNGTDCSGLGEGTCIVTSGCSANYGDCSSFNGNESVCSGTTGCSVSSSNTCPSQGDESSCVSAGCSWNGSSCDGDNSICSGSYYSSCSGTYYTCDGSYYTGSCTGVFGTACTGTVTCG